LDGQLEGNYLHFKKKDSKELPATLVRDFKWPRKWCQSVVLSDLIAFIWRRSICQSLANFLGVKFTFVQYRKWSTIANDPKTVPQMIPKMDLKWSSTVNDPRCQTQMIPEGKSECNWLGLKSLTHNIWTRKCLFRKLSEVSAVHQYCMITF